ncbi:unnamed protein product [Vitrella brassicaformis CCMP3155]|uniref:Uncharacterized protein n=2 Tax=Vitrella brassicaformis TaxID=1169539 RepID=A0A0G4ELQ8_VITBC|nr:unnamed protein product [Vitrella brassicaformis CCMP3155]|mmetsp:Transcript_29144/g.84261  ORF Transcript_29144/g.84261 Transcript_29144/m.84261 type:complete len:581 (+) Transcript_29144:13-1755(+)|eukprot:CEL97954.1 unnamed protein product [Vitrella brassicaformis CCMP3155]
MAPQAPLRLLQHRRDALYATAKNGTQGLLASIEKAARTPHASDPKLWERYAARATALLPQFSPAQLCRLLFGFHCVGVRDTRMLNEVAERLLSGGSEERELSVWGGIRRPLAETRSAEGEADARDGAALVSSEEGEEGEDGPVGAQLWQDFTANDSALLAKALAKHRFFHLPLLRKLTSEVERQLCYFTPADVATLLPAYLTLEEMRQQAVQEGGGDLEWQGDIEVPLLSPTLFEQIITVTERQLHLCPSEYFSKLFASVALFLGHNNMRLAPPSAAADPHPHIHPSLPAYSSPAALRFVSRALRDARRHRAELEPAQLTTVLVGIMRYHEHFQRYPALPPAGEGTRSIGVGSADLPVATNDESNAAESNPFVSSCLSAEERAIIRGWDADRWGRGRLTLGPLPEACDTLEDIVAELAKRPSSLSVGEWVRALQVLGDLKWWDPDKMEGILCHLLKRLHALQPAALLTLTRILTDVYTTWEGTPGTDAKTDSRQIATGMQTVRDMLELIPHEVNGRVAMFSDEDLCELDNVLKRATDLYNPSWCTSHRMWRDKGILKANAALADWRDGVYVEGQGLEATA